MEGARQIPPTMVYWMERLLRADEDPLFLTRRLLVFMSEDVGMADSNALRVAVAAQQAGFVRTPLMDHDLTVADHHGVMARVEIAPGVSSGRHTHPGEELGYVIEGEFTVRTKHPDGTTSQKTMKVGDCCLIAAYEHEQFINTGKTPALIWQVTHTPGEVIRGNS